MGEILGKAKTVRELLKGQKYSIEYFQREYKWQRKQIHELLDDLVGEFLDGYQPGTRSRLPFKPHTTFRRADLDARGDLYRRLAELVWDPENLLMEAGVHP